MNADGSTAAGLPVTVLRMGVGKQEMTVPEGATLADLLRAAGLTTENVQVYIDGVELAERLVLQAGMIVTLIPGEHRAPEYSSWKEGIGAFHGDPVFDEVMKAVEEARQAEKEPL